jgi:integrase
MASLHKDPHGRSPYFYAAYKLPNGKRAFKSTKQTDINKAKRVANKWEDASKLADRGELTEEASRKVLDQIREIAGDRPLPVMKVRQVFEDWLAEKHLSQKESTGARYEKPVKAFLKSLGPRVDKSLAHLVPQDIQNFRDTLSRSGISAATVKFDLQIVRSVLATAHNEGLISNNPALAIKFPRATHQKRDVFTPADIRALLAEADQDWKTAILIGFYTGARLSDATSMTWDQVNLAEGLIGYTQGKTEGKGKTGGKLEVPLHPDLEEHLLRIAGDKAGSLCSSLVGLPTSGQKGLSNQFTNLMAKAGIDRQVQSTGKRKFSSKSFHSLRHSFASALANARISADVRMLLTGHQSLDVHQRYTHMQLKGLREAIAALPRLS